MRCLDIRNLLGTWSFGIRFVGRECCYELELKDNVIPSGEFLIHYWGYYDGFGKHTTTTESEFYEKVDRLLNTLTLTNEIPFKLYGVK